MKNTLHTEEIALLLNGKILQAASPHVIYHLAIDSRNINAPQHTLFFCIKGLRNNGHDFIDELYQKGIRNFVVDEKRNFKPYKAAHFIQVANTLKAFQKLASIHRKKFDFPIIAITGSNGKTIVKEWLHQMLQFKFKIVRSPKSYNSQVGVPLSLWQIEAHHQLGIFEAGISKTGEMKLLQNMILPDIGIITNIGAAHDEGFSSVQEKIREKLCLFKSSKVLIYPADNLLLHQQIQQAINEGILPKKIKLLTWGFEKNAWLHILSTTKKEQQTLIQIVYQNKKINFSIPFTDTASIENVMSVLSVAAYFNLLDERFTKRLSNLSSIEMRLELKKGIHQCVLINDSYNADLNSFQSALNFLSQQAGNKAQCLILSDMMQTGMPDKKLYEWVSHAISKKNINRFIGIGKKISSYKNLFQKNKKLQLSFYESTNDFLSKIQTHEFQNETILIKGSRVFEFEKISQFLEEKKHHTVLEINLSALVRNLNQYHQLLKKKVKMMAMVKAASYGIGSFEVAKILAFNRVDYFGVAYTDEGIAIRHAGITTPIMVMNVAVAHLNTLLSYQLEPVIFSLHQLKKIIDAYPKYSHTQNLKIHIELETGMHRLGFDKSDLHELTHLIKTHSFIQVASIFSHLAAAENKAEDTFTQKQIDTFLEMYQIIATQIKYAPMRHLLNSAGIVRFPEAQFEMVRLGLGLYGIDSTQHEQLHLESVGQLKTIIAQIKHLKKGDSVGYNRSYIAKKPIKIATINIGYADGLDRRLGNGIGCVWIGKNKANIIGRICMDMTMIDVSHLEEVQEGDEVIVFGQPQSVSEIAAATQTIPYEILTGISSRVARVYFQE